MERPGREHDGLRQRRPAVHHALRNGNQSLRTETALPDHMVVWQGFFCVFTECILKTQDVMGMIKGTKKGICGLFSLNTRCYS